MFTPILMPDKNTHELGNNSNPTSKKLKFSRFFLLFLFVRTKKIEKVGEKQSIMSLSM